MIELTLNGAQQELDQRLTITQLLDRMQLSGKRLAVERNGEIVPKTEHPKVCVEDGDHIEIVVAVGGG